MSHIRTATRDDIPAIRRLYIEQFGIHAQLDPFTNQPGGMPDEIIEKAFSDENTATMLAQEGDTAVGLLVLHKKKTPALPFRVERSYAYLADIVVLEAFRGRGIGRQLLNAAKDWTRAQGLAYLELSVYAANHGARRLYESEGFASQMIEMRCLL